jgi:hypothetical protein
MVPLTNLLANSDGRGNERDISVNAAEGDDKAISRIHNNPRRYRGLLILIFRLTSSASSSSSSRLRLRTVKSLVVPVAFHALVEEKASILGPRTPVVVPLVTRIPDLGSWPTASTVAAAATR